MGKRKERRCLARPELRRSHGQAVQWTPCIYSWRIRGSPIIGTKQGNLRDNAKRRRARRSHRAADQVDVRELVGLVEQCNFHTRQGRSHETGREWCGEEWRRLPNRLWQSTPRWLRRRPGPPGAGATRHSRGGPAVAASEVRGRKAVETRQVGVNHAFDVRHPGILRRLRRPVDAARRRGPVVPAVPLRRRDGRGRHGLLVQGASRDARRGACVRGRPLILEADRRVLPHALRLRLHGLVHLRGPRAGAVAGRRLAANVEAREAALQTGVVHVEVAPLV